MARRRSAARTLQLILAGVWMVFTVSLAGWWLVFGLRQIDHLRMLDSAESARLVRQQRMLVWEGSVLILVVFGGGIALLTLAYREQKRYEQVRDFFASFSHDLKTSLASVRLQGDILREDDALASNPSIKRLLGDVSRLELQLENSLFVANAETGGLLRETVPLSRVLERVQNYWPDLPIQLDRDALLRVDSRAIESVLKNLVQNALLHGEATAVSLSVSETSPDALEIQVDANGKPFEGEVERLGEPYYKKGARGGSGLGLYLSRVLLRQMQGDLRFRRSPSGGLQARITVCGGLDS